MLEFHVSGITSIRHSMPSQPLPQDPSSKFCHPDLMERISSWRARVHSHCAESHGGKTNSAKPKPRHQKPYARPMASTRSRESHDRGCNLPEPSSYTLVPGVAHENPSHSLTTSDTYHHFISSRGSYKSMSPDPLYTLPTSYTPSYLAGEYCRIMALYDQLQMRRRNLEIACLRKVGDPDITQQLLDIGVAIQRIIKPTRSIVKLNQELGFNLDLSAIYAKYHEQVVAPPKPTPVEQHNDNFIKMPQARHFSEGWKFNPL